jgi:multidrug efflux pump subunit AcrB
MWIVRLALRRPYTFVVAALVLLLLTPFVLLRTPTDIFPAIDIPVVSAVWVYNGLNAQEVEQRILYNHERIISALVNDIEHIESTAYNGAGVIKVFLQPGASVSDGVAQVTASAQTILRFLPPGITPPFIIRYNASSVPILQYSLASKKFSEQELQDMAMNLVKVGLSTVQGASVPYPYGGKARVVAVDLDLPALQAKNLAPQDVVNAFNAQNFVLPSGTAKTGPTEYNISLNSNPTVLNALNDLPVKTVNGAVIRVGDVAQVHDGYQPQQNVVRLDGMRGVLLTILKSGLASTLRVVEGVNKAVSRMLSGLPPELELKEFADQSLFVRATVLTAFADVENNLAAKHLLASEYEQVMSALQSARKQLEVANNRYTSGLVTYLEVATAQSTVLGTERTGMRLRGQQLVAVVALVKSLGGGWHDVNKENNELGTI